MRVLLLFLHAACMREMLHLHLAGQALGRSQKQHDCPPHLHTQLPTVHQNRVQPALPIYWNHSPVEYQCHCNHSLQQDKNRKEFMEGLCPNVKQRCLIMHLIHEHEFCIVTIIPARHMTPAFP